MIDAEWKVRTGRHGAFRPKPVLSSLEFFALIDPNRVPELGRHTILGIWRINQSIGETAGHRFYAAQSADAAGSNRWPHVVRIAADRFRDQTHRYIEAAKALSHPSIMPVVDGSADAGQAFVVMPRIQGVVHSPDADSSIAALPLAVNLWAARQIADALVTVHRAGWVHAAVCPRHVIRNRMGAAILCDFGSSRRVHTSGTVIDRRVFTAPEARHADHAAIPAMDIYGLGQTLRRWIGKSPTALRPHPGVDELIQSMTSIVAADRPTAVETADALAKVETQALEEAISPVRLAA